MCLKGGLFKIWYNPYNNNNQPFKNENIIYVIMWKGLSALTLNKQSKVQNGVYNTLPWAGRGCRHIDLSLHVYAHEGTDQLGMDTQENWGQLLILGMTAGTSFSFYTFCDFKILYHILCNLVKKKIMRKKMSSHWLVA